MLNVMVIVPNVAFGLNSLLSMVWSMVDATGGRHRLLRRPRIVMRLWLRLTRPAATSTLCEPRLNDSLRICSPRKVFIVPGVADGQHRALAFRRDRCWPGVPLLRRPLDFERLIRELRTEVSRLPR